MVAVNSEDVYVSFRSGVNFRSFLDNLVANGYVSSGSAGEILANSVFTIFGVMDDGDAKVFASYDIVDLIDESKNDLDNLVHDVFSGAVSRRMSHVRRRPVVEYRYYGDE